MFRSVNPATGQEFATYAELSSAQVEEKLGKAYAAFLKWRESPMSARTDLLKKIAAQYEANKDRLARMATMEMGKTYASAVGEIDKSIAAFHHYAEHGPAMLVPLRHALSTGGSAEVHWLPQGPVLAMMPWNFPYWQVVRFIAPTILAGNVGLLKHASNVQGVAGLL